jgi:hypothetical protein
MFLLHSTDDGRVPSLEYLPAGAITPKVGLALTQSSGNLAIATGTTKPTYICMVDGNAALTAGTEIPVFRVDPDMIFETTFSASAADIKIGNKVTLHASNGGQVTATTTSGVAEVVYMDGTASGSMCRVRFPA